MTTQSESEWAVEEIAEVAKRQKQIIWMLLLSIVAQFIPYATIVTGIIQIGSCAQAGVRGVDYFHELG